MSKAKILKKVIGVFPFVGGKKKKGTPLVRKGPKTIKGFKPKIGKERDPVVENLTTIKDVPMEDIEVPSYLKKRMSPVNQAKFKKMLQTGKKAKASKFAQERTK
tara:strand:+ start:131 stop:442 length:312 start_codon:yes stop_codon:yes gene_type:complete